MRRSLAFFVLIVLGAILVLIGLVTGISSHQITYQHVGQGTIAHYISGSGTGYLQMSNSRSFYIVNENDFIPVVKGTNTFKDGDTISFMYQPGDTTDIDVSSNTGTHLVGTASKVVEITSFVNGQQEFKTNAYIQHPRGFDQNNWGIGGGLLVVGLLTIGGSFFLPKRKAKAIGFSAAPPSSIGMQPPVNQYQQPYQGAAQYPQQPGQYSPPGQYAPQQPGQYPPGQYPLPEQQSGYPQQPFPQRGQYKPTQRADPSN